MKKICLLLLIIIFLSSCSKDNKQSTTETTYNQNIKEDLPISSIQNVLNYDYIKAIWLSQFDLYNIYTEDGKQRNIEDFEKNVQDIILNIKSLGFNTIILQIRPNGDSFYQSDIYPPSKYVAGSYSGEIQYDPTEIITEIAHSNSISVQAWINPYRCMSEKEIVEIDDDYLIKKWYDEQNSILVLYNGYYYLNPYYKKTNELIVSGVKEILDKNTFDGLHIDDYFYPTDSEDFDQNEYKEYIDSGGKLSLDNFRRNNVNILVSEIYSTAKEHNSDLLFGISPAGNIERNYNQLYADIYAWCSETGYIDYISPQIYFGLEHQTHPFDRVFSDWCNLIKNDDIKLVVGMTLEKAYTKEDKWAGNGSNEWKKQNDIIRRCILITETNKKCQGLSFFSYQFFFDPITNHRIKETYNETENFLPQFITKSHN